MKTSTKLFRKSELRLNGEKGTTTWGDPTIIIYKAMQYRWEDGETADPQIGNESYHLTEIDAIIAAQNIDLDLGFTPQVDKIEIKYDLINSQMDFQEEIELREFDKYSVWEGDYDTVWTGEEKTGEKISPDAIVVGYRHHRYMGYSYDIEYVNFVRYTNLKTESDLRNDSDSLRSSYYVTFDDLDELADYFEKGNTVPFDKTNSGSRLVREFLSENGHPDYIEETEDEETE